MDSPRHERLSAPESRLGRRPRDRCAFTWVSFGTEIVQAVEAQLLCGGIGQDDPQPRTLRGTAERPPALPEHVGEVPDGAAPPAPPPSQDPTLPPLPPH